MTKPTPTPAAVADELERLFKAADHTDDDIRYYSGGSSHNEDAEKLLKLVRRHSRAILTALRAERGDGWRTMDSALMAVVEATRAYLPPDGITAQECINRILAATDNARINPIIERIEHGRA